MKRKLVVGNWKMNGDLVRNQALFERLIGSVPAGVDCAVCVPFPYLPQGRDALEGSGIGLGAQNLSEFEAGAHTGEVSGPMLLDFGCRYVIVGHSERRTLLGESDGAVARKCAAALRVGLVPIVCVGETLAEREDGRAEDVLRRQLDALAECLDAAELARLVIAYEPLWAIGTGRAASPGQIREILSFVRRWLHAHVADGAAVKVVYGGSVKTEGALALLGLSDVDGALVGGASLVADEFLGICHAAAEVARDPASN